jgi:hypothetical protein
MTNYDDLLAEAKSTASGTAKHYIPKLYDILTKEEGKTPEDAREIIENDLKLYWSKATIRKFLPAESKDTQRVEAGSQTGKTKKEIIELTNKGSARTVPAEQGSVGEKEPKSGSFESPSVPFEEQADEDQEDEENEQSPNMSTDAVFTAKRLAKALEDIRDLYIKLEDRDKTISQLQEVVKKDSFKPATDEANRKRFMKMAIPMLTTELRKLTGQGWHFVNADVEYVS